MEVNHHYKPLGPVNLCLKRVMWYLLIGEVVTFSSALDYLLKNELQQIVFSTPHDVTDVLQVPFYGFHEHQVNYLISYYGNLY